MIVGHTQEIFFFSCSPDSQEELQKYHESLLIKSGPQQYGHGRSGGGFRSTTTNLGEDFQWDTLLWVGCMQYLQTLTTFHVLQIRQVTQ
jgi:hypothetical protein